MGRGFGLVVYLLDVGKGLVPVLLAGQVAAGEHALAAVQGLCGLAAVLGHGAPDMESAVRDTLSAIGLPAALPAARPAEELLSAMASDKKKRGGALHLVVPFAFGDVRVLGDVPNDAVRAAWRAVGAG